MLATPDLWQREDYDCGAVAVDIALAVLGVRSRFKTLVMANPIDGTHPTGIESLLRSAGLAVQSGTMNVSDLRYHTSKDRPVLCPVSLLGGHWVVVRGLRGEKVYYQCPAQGRKSLSVSDWSAVWQDRTRAGHAFDSWGIAVR